jgi:P27 family predicted phage terminase small subunit
VGRPKKSASQKRREGNAGRRKIKLARGAKLEKAPKPPKDLGAEGRRVWEQVTAYLLELGRLSAVDLEALRILCDCWQLYRDLDRFTDPEHALMEIETKGGGSYYQEHPGWRIRQAMAARLEKYWRKFGLTPADRIQLDISLGGDDDEDQEFERKR